MVTRWKAGKLMIVIACQENPEMMGRKLSDLSLFVSSAGMIKEHAHTQQKKRIQGIFINDHLTHHTAQIKQQAKAKLKSCGYKVDT